MLIVRTFCQLAFVGSPIRMSLNACERNEKRAWHAESRLTSRCEYVARTELFVASSSAITRY